MNHERKVLEEMAAGVHLSLALGHGLSAIYNFLKAKRVDRWVAFHVAAGILDLKAVHTHVCRVCAD